MGANQKTQKRGGMMKYVKQILYKIRYYLYYAVFVVVCLVFTYQKGKKNGTSQLKSKIQDETIDKLKTSMERAKNAQTKIDATSDNAAINELRNKWMRKNTDNKDSRK